MESVTLTSDLSTKICSISPKQIIKIWVTKPNTTEPVGGLLNELRLIHEVKKHPDKNLTLVYEPKHLTPEALQKIHDFSRINHITLLSVDEVELKLDQLGERGQISVESLAVQKKLLQCARKEMILPGGNLAAASDILRLLTPVLSDEAGPRMYVDVDESLLVGVTDRVDVPENGLIKTKRNNDFILCPQPESELMRTIRAKLLSHYEDESILKVNLKQAAGSAAEPLRFRHSIYALAEKVVLDSIHDIFEFREMVTKQIKTHQATLQADPYNRHNQDMLNFWKNVYLYSVIDITGPTIFTGPNFKINKIFRENSYYELYFFEYNPISGDISWGNDPQHLKKEQSMEKAGHKITSSIKQQHALRLLKKEFTERCEAYLEKLKASGIHESADLNDLAFQEYHLFLKVLDVLKSPERSSKKAIHAALIHLKNKETLLTTKREDLLLGLEGISIMTEFNEKFSALIKEPSHLGEQSMFNTSEASSPKKQGPKPDSKK